MNTSFKSNFLYPYLFCLAIIIGPAYNMYVHYDFSHSIDTQSYLALSNGDLTVKPIHRYRLIIPVVAKIISIPIESLYTSLWPHRSGSLWPLQLAYFLLNTFLTALYGWIVYHFIRLYTKEQSAVIVALVAILTSRWISYIAGLPLTDSLYLIVIAGLLYAIKTHNRVLSIALILLGPLAKESFLIFTPFILIAAPVQWYYKILIVAGSFLLILGQHSFVDYLINTNTINGQNVVQESLIEILTRHIHDITDTLHKLSGFRGLGEIFTVLGVFTFLLLFGIMRQRIRKEWTVHIEKKYWVFFGCIIIHALLSGDAARMLYFGAPIYAVMMAFSVQHILQSLKKEGILKWVKSFSPVV